MELYADIRIAICDDEPGYRRILHEKILQDSICHDVEVQITEYESGTALLEAIDRGFSADVFFLDIQMEQGTDDGIRLGRELRSRGVDGLIIYVTGFIDYVQTGYEVRAFRYLLKSQISEKLPQILRDIRQELAGEDYFFQTGGETVHLDKRKILYLESDIRLLHLITLEEEYKFYGNLNREEKELGEYFLRCHKSYLVNMRQIQKYSNNQIIMKGGAAIPISRSYAKQVKERLILEMK